MSDRKVTLELSKDGGHNWPFKREQSLGELGEYEHRVRFLRCGRGRRVTGRVVVSSPIRADFMGGFADIEVKD